MSRKRHRGVADSVLCLAQLLVSEGSPEVPARHGAERTPNLTETFDIATCSVHRLDGPLKADVAKRQHVGIPEDHDAEYRNCPRTNALDSRESLLPCVPLRDLEKNVV